MATKIRGVTVTIGGDTSPLAQALQGVNTLLSKTQSELRDVQKGLKFNPQSVDLLAQKQKLLSDQLAQTKEKSDALNKIMQELERRKGLGENVDDQIRAVQREMTAVQKTIESTNKALNNLASGDTTPLAQSLNNVNSKLEITQKELKEVEKSLKIDPRNVDVLAQKQKLLSDQLVQTRAKSEALNKIMQELEKRKGLGENVDDQIREVQRELVKAESAIKSTDNALSGLNSSLKNSARETELFGKDIKKASDQVIDLDDKLNNKLTKGIEAMGVAALAGGAVAITAFKDFGNEMVKVKTLIDESVMSYDDAKQMVRDLAKSTGVAAGELASAAYDALSASVKTEELSKVLATAARTSEAGFADVGTTMDVLTTIMNSYGISADKVTQISDKLIATQDKGKLQVGELSQGLGGLIGVASEAGVTLDEVLAATAALTLGGLQASEAINAIKAAISNIIKPSGEAQKSAQSLGLKFNAQALEAKGLSGVLEDVKRKTHGNTETMAKLFGSVEALNAVMKLTGKDGSKAFTESLNEVTNASENMQKAFETVKGEPSEKLTDALNALAVSAIEVGEALTPIIQILTSFLLIIAAIDPQVIVVIGTLVLVATVILQIVKVIETLTKLGGPIGELFGGFNSQAMRTTAIVLGVVAALIALLAIITVILGRSNELNQTMSNVSTSVGNMQNTVNQAGKNVPRYASGTRYHRGGGAIITEYGAEQLTLPNGAQYVVMPKGTKVDNAATTQSNLRAISGTAENVNNIFNINVQNVQQLDEIVNWYTRRRQTSRAAGERVI